MNKVLRYRGSGKSGKVTAVPGYFYTTGDGVIVIDELGKELALATEESVAKASEEAAEEADAAGGQTAAGIASLEARIGLLEDKVSALSKTNTEAVAAEAGAPLSMTDPSKDYVVSGEVSSTANVNARSLEMKGVEVSLPANAPLTSGNAILVNAADEVSIRGSGLSMEQATSSNLLKVTGAESIVVRDTKFAGTTFNTIMTGQNTASFVKTMLIDNCDFDEDCKHINVWFAGHADGAVLTISNCRFRTGEQFLCISDFADPGNKLTVNIVNCAVENHDEGSADGAYGYDYAGFMFIESRNAGDYAALVEKNPFGNGKCVINISNLTVKGVRITEENFNLATGEAGQGMYFYHKQSSANHGCIRYTDETKDLFPVITVR